MCRLVRLLWSDVNLMVLRGLSFLGPQRRHRRRRQRRLYLPPLEPKDSARTRGPLTGARDPKHCHNTTHSMTTRSDPQHTAPPAWLRQLLFHKNIKEELKLQLNAYTSLNSLTNNCKHADFRPKTWTSSKSLQMYKGIHLSSITVQCVKMSTLTLIGTFNHILFYGI